MKDQPSLYMSLIKKCSKNVNQNSKPVFRTLHVVTPVPQNKQDLKRNLSLVLGDC